MAQASSGMSLPATPTLMQNYPNPFNSITTIRYSVPQAGNASLKLFNVLGQEVQTFIDADHLPGMHEITVGNEKLASGVYLYRLKAGEFTETKKLLIVR
ncbi:MAG: T9SS type A sorting domain-containing protein [Bacteroidota bacterium]